MSSRCHCPPDRVPRRVTTRRPTTARTRGAEQGEHARVEGPQTEEVPAGERGEQAGEAPSGEDPAVGGREGGGADPVRRRRRHQRGQRTVAQTGTQKGREDDRAHRGEGQLRPRPHSSPAPRPGRDPTDSRSDHASRGADAPRGCRVARAETARPAARRLSWRSSASGDRVREEHAGRERRHLQTGATAARPPLAEPVDGPPAPPGTPSPSGASRAASARSPTTIGPRPTSAGPPADGAQHGRGDHAEQTGPAAYALTTRPVAVPRRDGGARAASADGDAVGQPVGDPEEERDTDPAGRAGAAPSPPAAARRRRDGCREQETAGADPRWTRPSTSRTPRTRRSPRRRRRLLPRGTSHGSAAAAPPGSNRTACPRRGSPRPRPAPAGATARSAAAPAPALVT